MQENRENRDTSIFQTSDKQLSENKGLQLIKALKNHHVEARVTDIDYNRQGVAVETDYIIEIRWNSFEEDTKRKSVKFDDNEVFAPFL